MKVTYRANGDTAVLTEEAGRQLVAAGICDAVAEPPKKEPPPKKGDKPTKVEPMTTEDMPTPPKKVA